MTVSMPKRATRSAESMVNPVPMTGIWNRCIEGPPASPGPFAIPDRAGLISGRSLDAGVPRASTGRDRSGASSGLVSPCAARCHPHSGLVASPRLWRVPATRRRNSTETPARPLRAGRARLCQAVGEAATEGDCDLAVLEEPQQLRLDVQRKLPWRGSSAARSVELEPDAVSLTRYGLEGRDLEAS